MTENKRILMALTRFDIGGAETHVLELSLELSRMGYHVVVVSNGGVYEKNLEQAGIAHYKIPLHSKTPLNMAKSLKLLKKVIKEENIDIVHAHGRIPAFLCGILKKSMDFTFVTTAHWVFDTSHGLKYLSNWGEKVMSVSEDIKTYLMENYKTNPTDIFVTINGIDTNKFNKDADASSVIEEFSLSPDSKKIVYISRMDADRAQVAFELSEITPELVRICPDIEIVIVGGGNVFDKLKDKCDKINEELGKRHLILTGGRTDIYKFAALGDIFVGVSRSALEAMACEKPVIVAGNEGYIGIFDESKLPVSIDTNFCCRGLEASNPELLLRDLKILLANPKEENEKLGAYGRETILNNYSLSKMARDCEKMYISACDSKRWDAVISGYYGFNNAGDESLLHAMIENLRAKKDDVRLMVLSKEPKKTEMAHGVYAVNRYNFFKIRKTLKESKLLIFGGGSLIQDVTSSKSLWYYLSVIKEAIKIKIPVMFYANGIGPVTKEKNRTKVIDVLKKVDIITLRDENSYEEVKEMGIDLEKVTLTADPALTIEKASKEEILEIFKNEGIPTDKKILGISIRSWKECNANFWTEFSKGVEEICKKYDLIPVFIPLKIDEDTIISKQASDKMGIESYILSCEYNSGQLVGIINECEFAISMRLHSMIYASACGVCSIGISYDPKVSGFAQYIGIKSTLDLEDVSKDALLSLADAIMENKDELEKALGEKVYELKGKALKNADMASEFIEKQK